MLDCRCPQRYREYQAEVIRRKTSSFQCRCEKNCACVCECCPCKGGFHGITAVIEIGSNFRRVI